MSRSSLVSLFIVVVAVVAGSDTIALANSAAPYSRPTGAVPGVVVERPSPVVVEREDLAIDCAKGGGPVHPDCSFVATYFLLNPTAEEEELLGSFYTAERPAAYRHSQASPANVVVALDGVDASAEATQAQLDTMDARVRRDPEIAALIAGENGLELKRSPFRVVIGGGRRAKLVFQGVLNPTRYFDDNPRDGYILPPIVTRHLAVSRTDSLACSNSEDDFLYLVSPIAEWAGDPEVHVTLRRLAANELAPASPAAGWTTTREGADAIDRVVMRASRRQNLRFRLSYRPGFVKNGGPLAGIGPRIGREELRLRFGYEVGLSQAFILGATADTNFDDYVTPALTVEVASPSAIIFPSLGLGAGVPVQLRRGVDPRVGARAQLTLSFPIVSLVFPIDVYPVENSSGSHVEGAFLTQLSF